MFSLIMEKQNYQNGQNKFSKDNVNAHFEQLVLDEKKKKSQK